MQVCPHCKKKINAGAILAQTRSKKIGKKRVLEIMQKMTKASLEARKKKYGKRAEKKSD